MPGSLGVTDDVPLKPTSLIVSAPFGRDVRISGETADRLRRLAEPGMPLLAFLTRHAAEGRA